MAVKSSTEFVSFEMFEDRIFMASVPFGSAGRIADVTRRRPSAQPRDRHPQESLSPTLGADGRRIREAAPNDRGPRRRSPSRPRNFERDSCEPASRIQNPGGHPSAPRRHPRVGATTFRSSIYRRANRNREVNSWVRTRQGSQDKYVITIGIQGRENSGA